MGILIDRVVWRSHLGTKIFDRGTEGFWILDTSAQADAFAKAKALPTRTATQCQRQGCRQQYKFWILD